MDNALILFSRLPIGRETKTRLAPLLNEQQREDLHRAMWADIFPAVSELRSGADIFLYWTGSGGIEDYAALIPPFFHRRRQCAGSLGERMCQAMREAFDAGYRRVCLMGTDIPSVSPDNIRQAFIGLNDSDVVLGPSLDGGYWLIGMRRFTPEAFDISSWGGKDVLHATLAHIRNRGGSCTLADALPDIDTPEDVQAFLSQPSSRSSRTRDFLFSLFQK
ncbi:MAG: TIGR04282 family arsenosugar biosynthesis glycosyltransferase [Fretibacterium sp.]|nr:TIGR04282 family arsenosugar biosynthesis glycosyltransferase [Fretibacterium sp.]